MHISKKIFSCLFFLLFFSWIFTKEAFAVSEFQSSYKIDYTIYENGIVFVNQRVNLINRLAEVYATEYSLTIGSNNLSEIKAWDEFGSLEPKIEVKENKTQITLVFKEKVIGKDKGRTFHLVYKSPDFAFIKGKVLEVGIPLLAKTEDLTNYEVDLHVPLVFGKTTYIIPNPNLIFEANGFRHYNFSQAILKNVQSITATFGEFQIFDFDLKYHLKNEQKKTVITQIALPMDTPFQKIALNEVVPKPENVNVDQDGNWLANYRLDSEKTLDITARGKAKIFISAQKDFPKTIMVEESKETYLKPQKFWPKDDPELIFLVKDLKTPEAIYNFLVKDFSYNYNRLDSKTQRQGAIWALKNNQDLICTDFTDLFIALVRAAGIPAREVNGYAYTTNLRLRPLALELDVLHAWPEYYDESLNLWIPVDPTWGNTTGGLDFFHKLDLDHFAFVTRGVSSEYPISAGSYKINDNTNKDLNITFGSNFHTEPKAELHLSIQGETKAGLGSKGEIRLKNTGNAAIYQKPLKLTIFEVDEQLKSYEIPFKILPPFADEKIPIYFKTRFGDDGKNYVLVAEFADQKVDVNFKIVPLFPPQVIWLVIILTGILIFIITNRFLVWRLKIK